MDYYYHFFGILHMIPKVLYTLSMEVPDKWESASGTCKAGNEGCHFFKD